MNSKETVGFYSRISFYRIQTSAISSCGIFFRLKSCISHMRITYGSEAHHATREKFITTFSLVTYNKLVAFYVRYKYFDIYFLDKTKSKQTLTRII